MRVGVVAQRGNPRAGELATAIRERLEGIGVSVTVDETTGERLGGDSAPVSAMGDSDLVVSIGGDGTFLFVAREATPAPIVGVNLGEVGFLNAVAPEDAVAVLEGLAERFRDGGELAVDRLDRLSATGDGWKLPPALNEVLVHGPRRGRGGGGTITVEIGGDRYAESHADGVLVATPTGSTAYNLSEGGPLVSPSVDALVVTGMAPSGPVAPLVVSADEAVVLRLSGADRGWAIADGRSRRKLEPPATVTVAADAEPVRIAGPRTTFFDGLGKLE